MEALDEFETLWNNYRATSKRYSEEMLRGSLNGQAMKIKLDKNHKDFKRRLKWWYEDLTYMEKVSMVQLSLENEILWNNIDILISEDLRLFRVMVS